MTFLLNHPWLLFPIIVVSLILVLRLGHRIGTITRWFDDDELQSQVKGTRDALGLILSLLLGFTLAMAVPRFDARRHIIVEEANAIGTTYLRAKALPEPQSSHLQELLRSYVAVRIEFFNAGMNSARMTAATALTKELQNKMWSEAGGLARSAPSPIVSIFLASLNETIDDEAKRTFLLENRIPVTIWVMILGLAVLTMLTTGITMRRKFWFSMILMPLTIAIVVGLVADLDSPRGGEIRTRQETMLRLQAEMNSDQPGH